MLMSLAHRSLDKFFALLIALLIFYFAAFRGAGNDYDNYIVLVEALRSTKDTSILGLVAAAKEPLFALLIMISSFLSDAVVLPIVLLVLVAVVSKVAYAFTFIRNSAIFLGIYGIFIAPGLEFAAIRAAAGLGFLLFFLVPLPKKFRYTAGVIAAVSHIQFLPALIIAGFSRLNSIRTVAVLSIVLAILAHLLLTNITLIPIERSNNYADNKGTILASIPVLIYLVILVFSFPRKYLMATSFAEYSTRIVLYKTALVLIIISFPASYATVTISTRLLEIVSFLMLVLYFHSFELRRSNRLWIGFVVFILYLAVTNIYRGTWIMFNEFLLF